MGRVAYHRLAIVTTLKRSLASLRTLAFAGSATVRSLFFKSVDVDQEALGYLLSCCPVLEELSVHGSKSLVNLKVAGTSIKLKSLAICCCAGVERIEIFDTNTVSFSYHGHRINLTLTDVPSLVDLSVGGEPATRIGYAFAQIADISSQLHSRVDEPATRRRA